MSLDGHPDLTRSALAGSIVYPVTAVAITSVWTATRLAVLGDSTTFGVGDPLPRGGWRGVGPLLADALGADIANFSFTGARIGCVRERQLAPALLARADAAILIAGMNDTLRSDFDPDQIQADLIHIVTALNAQGAVVLLARYHDHGRVFRIPGPLRRALQARIARLNEVIDAVVAATGAPCLDLDRLPGAYETSSWAVDRLHPSELGHRMLASGFADLLAGTGCAVAKPVSMVCEGGRPANKAEHIAWLIIKGIPWLWRRGRDLVPYAIGIIVRSLLGNERPQPPAPVTAEAPAHP
ncbi:SGNH/GDSL hydrolase family protein [Actinokineospora sp. HUAS TT18]|uniref:SGNH/GDSL hydrolase family protein n=1 Tax=Actinokineospora sp. HUAS TT18 TaxID=3447451 RepID=UPI003F523E95